ncbi:proline racemase family protein [Paenarthrobacter sp. NPDC090520]|uniref:proline racemase family protein n=1 Tax=Paenarthrobacter sp. NPDC090520 TaxID=3364382 RepID=UPI00381E5D7B
MKFQRMYDCIETHSGEPIRIVTGGTGILSIPGQTVYDKMCWLRDNDDQLRKLLIHEPRGYPPVCVDIIVPSNHPEADVGFLILEPFGYSTMSGGNVGCVVTALLETGIIPMKYPYTDVVLEAPGGLARARAHCVDNKVESVTFLGVPSFVAHQDATLKIPGVGEVVVNIAYGGQFYVQADIAQFEGLDLTQKHARALGELSAKLILASREQLPVDHPDMADPRDNQVVTSFITKTLDDKVPTRHIVNATGMISYPDLLSWERPESLSGTIARDACGTGGSSMLAIEHARGNLKVGEEYLNESLCGIQNTLRIAETTKIGDYDAIVPEITMQAWVTGFSKWVLDDTDPFPFGYQMGDIW